MILDTLPESIENTYSVVSSDGKIIEGIIADLRIVIDELDMNFANAKSLILELARRLDETKTRSKTVKLQKSGLKDVYLRSIRENTLKAN
jgi:hypothetical protein